MISSSDSPSGTPQPSNERRLKIAFIGTHGVGKTTLAYGLAARLKARDVSLEVVVEVARRCPLPLNEATTLAAQAWILHTQVADELVGAARYPVVICDRSVLDNYVYLLLSHGPELALEELVNRWLQTYDLLVLVPALREGTAMADGLRSVDPSFREAVEERLRREIAKRNVPVLELTSDDRDGWIGEVERVALARLEPPQLELLGLER